MPAAHFPGEKEAVKRAQDWLQLLQYAMNRLHEVLRPVPHLDLTPLKLWRQTCQDVMREACQLLYVLRHPDPLLCLDESERATITQRLRFLQNACKYLVGGITPKRYDLIAFNEALHQYAAALTQAGISMRRVDEILKETLRSYDSPPGAEEHTNGAKVQSENAQPKEAMPLAERVMAFLINRTKALDRMPTLEEIRRAFPGEIEPNSTFYRNNPWFTTFRAGLRKARKQEREATRGHKNTTEDGSIDSVDAAIPAPNYHQDEED